MKKIFTLFAIAMMGVCAFAQEEYGPCPSTMELKLLTATNPANVGIELMLTNSSLNLNGFNMEVERAEGSESIAFKNFSATNYANVILQRLEGTVEVEDPDTGDMVTVEVTDAIRKQVLNSYCDVKWSKKTRTDGKEVFVMIEILTKNECRFFPVLETATAIGRMNIDMSACEDGTYNLIAPKTPQGLSYSYTQGPEPLQSWTTDVPVEITLQKTGTEIIQIPTGISTINADQPVDNRIFDLQGRELQSVPEHGIYIQNGKKYVK